MEIRTALLSDIDLYLQKHDMAPSTFGRMAVNDGKIINRLRAGQNVTLATIQRIRSFMASADGEAT